MTPPDNSLARMAEPAAAKPLRALLRMLTRAPSLIERPNKSRIRRDSRSKPTPWVKRR
jgi:hypothetical protein